MSFRMRNPVGAFALAAVLGFPFAFSPVAAQSPASGEAAPDVAALVRDMQEKGPRSHAQIGDFTMTFTSFRREFGKDGKVKENTRTFEVYVPDSYQNRKSTFRAPLLLTAEDGQPVPSDKIAKEREKLARELDEFERDPNKTGKRRNGTSFSVSPGESKTYRGFSASSGFFGKKVNALAPSVILDNVEYGAGRRETVNGREMVAVEFRAKPGRTFDKPVAYMSQLEGIVWIDVQDRTLARLEGWQRTPGKGTAFLSNARPAKAPVYYEQVRVAEGIWFPFRKWLFDDATTTMFPNLENGEVGFEFTNYRRFRSDVTVSDDEEK